MAESGVGQFGRYELRGQLGRGGFAQVYRAWDTLLFREVALKALLPHLAEDEGVRSRFVNEARALARLHHPAIVTVFDVGEVDGRPYFTMELIEGETLAARHPTGQRVDLDALLPALASVAAALDYLHQQGFVHRDIKPANIMLEHSGRILLMDFGIARALNEHGATLTGTSVGTPEYMAPEQVRGRPVGPEADIYALGVLSYRLLAGRAPFVGDTAAVLVGHASEPAPPLEQFRPGLPAGVYATIAAALAKDPAQRPPTAAALYEGLARPNGVQSAQSTQNEAATEPLALPATARVARGSAGARSGRAFLFGGIAAVMILLAALAGGAYKVFGGKQQATATRALPTATTAPSVVLAPTAPSAVPSATRPAVAPTRAPSQPPPTVVTTRTNPVDATGLIVNKPFGAALRLAPDSNAGIITILPCGKPLKELGEQTGWYQVSDGSTTGWVGGLRVATAGTTVDCRGAVTFQVNSTAAVQVAGGCSSVRDAPGRDARMLLCAPNGTVYRVTGGPVELGGEDWIPVAAGTNVAGWILGSELRPAT